MRRTKHMDSMIASAMWRGFFTAVGVVGFLLAVGFMIGRLTGG